MTIIGIDPAYAKPCAYAIFDDSDFQECGTFAPERLIATLEYLEGENFFDLIAVEDTFLGMNPATLIKLSWIVGGIWAWAQWQEMDFQLIRALEWQYAIPGLNKLKNKAKDKMVIETARGLAKTRKEITIDEASAIHIASYADRRACFSQKTGERQ